MGEYVEKFDPKRNPIDPLKEPLEEAVKELLKS